MRVKQINLRKLWLSLLLLVGATAIAVPGIQEVMDGNVAEVNGTRYETLQAAFDEATDGQTVTLLKDVDATGAMYSGDNRFNLWVKSGITVDGTENNYTITVKGRGIGVQGASESNKINVTFKNVTIKNVGNVNGRCIDTRGNLNSLTLTNATLTTAESSYTGYLQPLTIGGDQSTTTTVNITNSNIITVDNAKKGYAITTFNPVNMTIDESTLKGWACLNIKAADNSAGSNGSTITVTNNSTLVSANGTPGYSNSYSLIKIEDDNINVDITGSTVNVNGGKNTQSIVSFQKLDLSSSANCTVSMGDGNNVTLEGDYNYSSSEGSTSKLSISGGTFNSDPSNYLAEGFKAVKNDGTWTVHEKTFAAQIEDGDKYETLEAAFAAVKDGETVTLLDNVTLSGNLELALEGKTVTLDLATKTLNGRTNLKSGNLTVKNGTVNCEGGQPLNVYGSATAGAENYSVLTVAEDVTVSGDYGVCMFGPTASAKAGYGAVVNIAGTLNGTKGTVFVSGNLGNNIDGDMNNVVNITGKVNGNNDAGVALNGNATVNVKSGAEITGNTGIAVKRGVLNVEEGATVHATGAENLNPDPNNNGTEMTGAAISMTDTYNNYGAMSVNITGGTFTSDNTVALFKEDGTYANDATYAVSGGTFSSAVPAEFCAEGYIPADLGEGKYSVKAGSYVAQIGDEKYESLAAAVAAVPTNGTETTITMIANEMINVVGSAITIPANKNVVIDLNGFQVVGTAEGGSTSALITNKGTLTIKDSSDTNEDGTGTGKLISGATTTWIYDGGDDYSGSYASNTISNGGTLTIESGYVENLSTGSATYAVDNNSSGGNAILNVNGGLLKARSVAVRQFANSTTLKNEVNVAGGTVTAGYSGIWIQLPNSDATKAVKATLNVTGGTLTGGDYAFYDYSYGNSYDATQYNLSGGTFNGDIFSFGANININDGTYNGEVAVKQTKLSTVAVSGGKFGGKVYTYSDKASERFISGGIYAYNNLEEKHIADGYILAPNPDEATKIQYPYAVVNEDDYVFELIDKEVYELSNSKTFKHVTYTRTFNNTNWQSLFVPFDINVADYADKYEFAKIHMIALENDEEGFTSTSKIVVSYTKVTNGTLYANKPYLIKAKSTGTDVFVLENVTLKGCNDIDPIECNTTHANYSIVGSYQPVTATQKNPFMAMAGGTINPYQSSTIPSFRWVIRVSPKEDHYAHPSIEFVEDYDATGISSVSVDNDDVEGYYNVKGVRNETPVKGINIIRYKNGQTKKVVIK